MAAVTIKFLGGLGVIGRNCMAIRDGDDVIVVDAGLHFPELRSFGIDIALPDFRALEADAEAVRGIIITHGHEDHIGALGALSELVSAPVYGSRVSMALANKRLQEAAAPNEVVVVEDYETRKIGNMTISFFPVAHSVPDSMALRIDTSQGTIYHTGDFKLDPTPLDSRTTDLVPLAKLGAENKVDLLLIDSTNAEEPGWTESEMAVRPGLQQVFADNPSKRIICSCFASHIHRVIQLVEEARTHGRKIVPIGRSMVRVFEIGRELGLIRVPETDILDVRTAASLSPNEVCILSTGSQGEPRAALSLMARREHKYISLGADDLILLSSDAIPGNETDVGHLIDQLTRLGVDVVHAGMTKVHVSGHAKRDELRHVIRAADPKSVIPVHGEYRQMASVAKLVGETRPSANVLVAEDGFEVELLDGTVRKKSEFPAPYIYKSNTAGPVVTGHVVKQRRALQSAGVLFLTAYADSEGVRSVGIEQFGWLNSPMFESLTGDLMGEFERLASEAVSKKVSEPDMETHLQTRMKRYARKLAGVAPNTVVFFETDQGD